LENKSYDMQARVIALIFLAIFLVAVWSMLDIVLITFIFCFLFSILTNKIRNAFKRKFSRMLPYKLVVIFIYCIFLFIIVFGSYILSPIIANQVADIFWLFANFNFNELALQLNPVIGEFLMDMDIAGQLSKLLGITTNFASKITGFTIHFVLGLILSLLVLMEKEEIKRFGKLLEYSKMDFIYKYIIDFGSSFAHTFGQVMWVQLIIATINSLVSMLFLKLLGFPSILGLGIMIFLLGLIPVAGVIISLIPLTIIAYNIGGIIKIIEVLIMIAVIHALESYIMNPKLMSNRTKLPVCFTFSILLIGEHYLGVWGLLIGVPIVMFAVERLDIRYEEVNAPDYCLEDD